MKDLVYHIELTTVTPLAVGAGNDNDWVRGIDYVEKDKKVYVLDIQKAAELGADIDKLTDLFLKSDEKGICALLGNQLDKVARHVFPQPAFTTNPIKAFQRTHLYDKPVAAGSSIKGSIRSALFKALRNDEQDNKSVFGDMKEGTDFMRFIRVGDIEMPSTSLVNTKLFNLRKEGSEWAGGWKQGMQETVATYKPTGFNTLYECVEPGKKGYGTIGMAGNAYSLLLQHGGGAISHARQKATLMETGIQTLFHLINAATRSYLLKEKAFFETYTADRSEDIIDCIDRLLTMIPADDSCCLMKMSAGVGFHAITGDWQFDDYDQTGTWENGRDRGKKKYKSRKIAEYRQKLQLMGFVKLRVMSQEETVQTTAQQEANHHTILHQLLAPIQAREDAQRQAEDAKVQREKERAEELRKREAFNQLMAAAKELYAANQWDEAIAKAQEAIDVDPAQTETTALIEQCESAKHLKSFAEQEQDAKAAKFSKPLEQVLQGVSSIGNLIGTTGTWLKMNGKTFGNEEMTILTAAFCQLPAREQKNLHKKLKDLEKAIGKEQAAQFVSQI